MVVCPAGIMVGHVTPEAFDGGPLALVRDGDMITIDTKKRTLDLVTILLPLEYW